MLCYSLEILPRRCVIKKFQIHSDKVIQMLFLENLAMHQGFDIPMKMVFLISQPV